MFIITLNTGFKLFIVNVNFYKTTEQVSTKVSVASIISMIKSKYSCTRLIFRQSQSTFRFLRLKVSSMSTQKSCAQVRVQYSCTKVQLF